MLFQLSKNSTILDVKKQYLAISEFTPSSTLDYAMTAV